MSAIPGIKKAFVNFLIETLLAAPKSFRLSGIRLINLDSAEPAQRALSTARIKINKRKMSAKITLRKPSAKPSLLELCRGGEMPAKLTSQ